VGKERGDLSFETLKYNVIFDAEFARKKTFKGSAFPQDLPTVSLPSFNFFGSEWRAREWRARECRENAG
jgi:hypothetical protein